MQIQNKSQIISALSENVDAFNNYIAPLTKEQFETSPGGKWSDGQNLDHLIRAIKPLQLAYGLPNLLYESCLVKPIAHQKLMMNWWQNIELSLQQVVVQAVHSFHHLLVLKKRMS